MALKEGLKKYWHAGKNALSLRSTDLHYSDPAILWCDYGKVAPINKSHCSMFGRVLTTNGLDFGFNQAPFWNVFKKSAWSIEFYEELIEEVTQKSIERSVLRPLDNGKSFALRFLFRQPSNLKEAAAANTKRIAAVHPSNTLAPLSRDGIEILPGNHYSILVTPTVIQTKEELLSLDPTKRGCMSLSDPNKLKIFATYTYENCLFECQLESAFKACGCIPWNYPRMGDDIPLCTSKEKNKCFSEILITSRDPTKCSHCLIDCDTTSYAYNVLINNVNVEMWCPKPMLTTV